MSWNDLPVNLKQKIVKNLDFVDRISLAISSKSELELVKSTEFNVKELRLEHLGENKFRILLPGCFEAVIEENARARRLRNRRVNHDYILFASRRLVRKSDRYELQDVLNPILRRFFSNPNTRIETLRLDDTFFTTISLLRIPLIARIDNIIIEHPELTNPSPRVTVSLLDFLDSYQPAENHLKSVVCCEGFQGATVSEFIDFESEKAEDRGDFWLEPMGSPEPVVFDFPVFYDLETLIFPGKLDIKPRHLERFKARNLEIWSEYLKPVDLADLMERWDREGAPIGAKVKIGMAQRELNELWDRFEGVKETSDVSGVIPMADCSKEFFVFLEEPKKMCCEVRAAHRAHDDF